MRGDKGIFVSVRSTAQYLSSAALSAASDSYVNVKRASDASIAGFFDEKTANAGIILNVQFYDKRNAGYKRAGERTLRKKKSSSLDRLLALGLVGE
jgi:hypothetical protein